MNSKKAVFLGFFCILLLFSEVPALQAQNSFARGEELFMQNRPQEALSYLEAAIAEDPAHVQAFLYLGIVYLQMNRLDDAIAIYTRILPRGGIETARIAFNLGNAYFMKGDPVLARQYFTMAIETNPAFASAYLNRANTLVRTGDLADAIIDYEMYLSLQPSSPQREQVTRLIAFIREEFVAEEQRRIIAEEAARAEAERLEALAIAEAERLEALARAEAERIEAEAERLAAEARAEAERVAAAARAEAERVAAEARAEAERLAVEAERRRLLLLAVSESIQAAVEGTTGLSVGGEQVQDFESEFELE